jgi:hypothetical protein
MDVNARRLKNALLGLPANDGSKDDQEAPVEDVLTAFTDGIDFDRTYTRRNPLHMFAEQLDKSSLSAWQGALDHVVKTKGADFLADWCSAVPSDRESMRETVIHVVARRTDCSLGWFDAIDKACPKADWSAWLSSDSPGFTPVHAVAASSGSVDVLKWMLTKLGNQREAVLLSYADRGVQYPFRDGSTPVMAVAFGRCPSVKAAKLLVEAITGDEDRLKSLRNKPKEEENGTATHGYTALGFAVGNDAGEKSPVALVEYLLSVDPSLVYHTDRAKETPLSIAAQIRDVSPALLKPLLLKDKRSFGVLTRAGRHGELPIHYLVRAAARADEDPPQRPHPPYIGFDFVLNDEGLLKKKHNHHMFDQDKKMAKVLKENSHTIENFQFRVRSFQQTMAAWEEQVKKEQAEKPRPRGTALRLLLVADKGRMSTLEKGRSGNTALHVATQHGLYELVAEILRKNPVKPRVLAAQNEQRETAVMIATKNADARCVAALLGFSPKLLENSENDVGMLTHAIRTSQPAILEVLLQKKPELLFRTVDEESGANPLVYAVKVGSTVTTQAIMGLFQAPPAALKEYASQNEGTATVNALAYLKLSVHKEGDVSLDALHYAIRQRAAGVVDELLLAVDGIEELIDTDALLDACSSARIQKALLTSLANSDRGFDHIAREWDLSKRGLTSIHVSRAARKHLRFVTKVSVRFNKLTRFPRSLLNFPSLDVLDVSHNLIKQMEHADISRLRRYTEGRALAARQTAVPSQRAAPRKGQVVEKPPLDRLSTSMRNLRSSQSPEYPGDGTAGDTEDGPGSNVKVAEPTLDLDLSYNRLPVIPPELYSLRLISADTSGNPLVTSLVYPAWFFGLKFTRFNLLTFDFLFAFMVFGLLYSGHLFSDSPDLRFLVLLYLGVFFSLLILAASYFGLVAITWTDVYSVDTGTDGDEDEEDGDHDDFVEGEEIGGGEPETVEEIEVAAEDTGVAMQGVNVDTDELVGSAVAATGTEAIGDLVSDSEVGRMVAQALKEDVGLFGTAANLLTVASITLELPIILAFSFQANIPWPDAIVDFFNFFVLQFSFLSKYVDSVDEIVFNVGFWAAVALVILQRSALELSRFPAFGARVAAALQFSVTVLALPIFTWLLKPLDCTYEVQPAVPDDPGLSDLECWTGRHSLYAVVALVSFVAYYPMAILSGPIWTYRSNNLTIKFPSYFIIVSGQLKLVLAIFTSFFTSSRTLYLVVNILSTLSLLALIVTLQVPSMLSPDALTMRKVKILRTGTYAACVVGAITAAIVGFVDDDVCGQPGATCFGLIAFLIMIAVDIVIFVVTYLRMKRQTARFEEIARRGESTTADQSYSGLINNDSMSTMAQQVGKFELQKSSGGASLGEALERPVACQICTERPPEMRMKRSKPGQVDVFVWSCAQCIESPNKAAAPADTSATDDKGSKKKKRKTKVVDADDVPTSEPA